LEQRSRTMKRKARMLRRKKQRAKLCVQTSKAKQMRRTLDLREGTHCIVPYL
jgi:hypothetical protein